MNAGNIVESFAHNGFKRRCFATPRWPEASQSFGGRTILIIGRIRDNAAEEARRGGFLRRILRLRRCSGFTGA